MIENSRAKLLNFFLRYVFVHSKLILVLIQKIIIGFARKNQKNF